jgi:ABC-2 type transport system permease protein
MRTIWLVTKHDLAMTLRQRSFWFLSLLMPVLLMGLQVFYYIRDSQAASTGSDAEKQETASAAPAGMLPIGLVDEAGLTARIGLPPNLPPGLFVRYPDEASARAALEAGEIEQYVYIPSGYLATGQVTVYDRDFRLLSSGEDMGVAFGSDNEWVLPFLIAYNLTGDEQLALALRNPTPGALAEMHASHPPAPIDEETHTLVQLVSSVVPYVFYFLLLISSSYLMRSVVAEKENRTAEVLLLSVPPRQLMAGKMLAGSILVLLQGALWAGGGALVFHRGATLLRSTGFAFPPGFLVWAVLFLVFGYLVFASLMMAAGALSNTAREGGQVTWLLILPLLPTLMLGPLFQEAPNSPLILFLSLFPLSAPSAMVTRLAVGAVPVWQLLASLAGLAATAYLFVVLAGRFFQAGNLLSGTPFNWKRLARRWRR